MSKKTHWELFSTNALESFNPANLAETKKERDALKRKQRNNSFKFQLELDKMKFNKPKRNKDRKDEDEDSE